MLVKRWDDLRFVAVAHPKDYHVDYDVYEIDGWSVPEHEPLFHKKDEVSHPAPVETVEEADRYLHGFVKWDGCSNWDFDELERVMLHGCNREDVLRFGEVMARCWDWTAELCPHWSV